MAAPGKDGKKPAAAPAKAEKKGGSKPLYTVSGNTLTRPNKECPKCGAGVFMASHKDRWTCGKCHYTEFKKQ